MASATQHGIGIIFDLDGTLIDNNAAHVEAWRRAFAQHGLQISRARIQPEIGKGGDLLVPSILGEEHAVELGEALRDAEMREYQGIARRSRFPLTEGAMALLAELRRQRIPTAVATSSDSDVLRATLDSARLDLWALVDVIIDNSRAATSKPAPGVFEAALTELGSEPSRTFAVGDTVHDGVAAQGAGLGFIGLACGGTPREALQAAGAMAVFADPAELLLNLELFLPTTPDLRSGSRP
jgi:HAD superfamily hydrolase (TIGR01509 family)